MNEVVLIKKLKSGKQSALQKLIEIYGSYVGAIVKNMIGAYMPTEDIEEVVSDVFFSVWNNANKIDDGTISLKAYIAAIARNTAKNKLRKLRPYDCLLDDEIIFVDNGLDKQIEITEQKEIIHSALEKMSKQDRMIFLRYYYIYEKIGDISKALSINESTIKSKLYRGRKFLKQALIERGYTCED